MGERLGFGVGLRLGNNLAGGSKFATTPVQPAVVFEISCRFSTNLFENIPKFEMHSEKGVSLQHLYLQT